ncbi:hypothetical protein [Lysobacter niastensis]|uniref:Uncharacterized protein n=1 Tax=Lysobacter niastensis TaxID=380629 RepID=A0ABS0BAJ3_9GAMM|nr:hypothetical protein [Lysobacter niastensis]MBF6026011.1 hypothetical protein [Lysobacter niastensis]
MSTKKNQGRPSGSFDSKLEGAQAKRIISDRIAEDLLRFKDRGGSIEVLGTTRVLKRIDEPPAT